MLDAHNEKRNLVYGYPACNRLVRGLYGVNEERLVVCVFSYLYICISGTKKRSRKVSAWCLIFKSECEIIRNFEKLGGYETYFPSALMLSLVLLFYIGCH